MFVRLSSTGPAYYRPISIDSDSGGMSHTLLIRQESNIGNGPCPPPSPPSPKDSSSGKPLSPALGAISSLCVSVKLPVVTGADSQSLACCGLFYCSSGLCCKHIKHTDGLLRLSYCRIINGFTYARHAMLYSVCVCMFLMCGCLLHTSQGCCT